MATFSVLLAICAGNSTVSGEFPTQRPVTRSFDVFSDLRLHKRLTKQSRGWWFETQSHPLWRHCNVIHVYVFINAFWSISWCGWRLCLILSGLDCFTLFKLGIGGGLRSPALLTWNLDNQVNDLWKTHLHSWWWKLWPVQRFTGSYFPHYRIPSHNWIGSDYIRVVFLLNTCQKQHLAYWRPIKHGLTLNPTLQGNHMPRKVWDEIIYLFPNFNGATVEVWEWISNFIPHFTRHGITNLCWDQLLSILVNGGSEERRYMGYILWVQCSCIVITAIQNIGLYLRYAKLILEITICKV